MPKKEDMGDEMQISPSTSPDSLGETTPEKTEIVEHSTVKIVSGEKVNLVECIQNHECTISKVQYVLEKGKEYKLSPDVATILHGAGIVIIKK